MMLAATIAGGIAGLASIPHCAGMCGPLAGFACGRSSAGHGALRYQAGRVISYGLLGLAAGSVGEALSSRLAGGWPAAMVSWSLAFALALAALRLWRRAFVGSTLVALRPSRGPSWLSRWRPERLFRLIPREPLFFGLLTGLLPCGALAAAVAIAAGSHSATGGAATMIAFSATSGLGLIGLGWIVSRLRAFSHPVGRQTGAVVLMVASVLFVIRPISGLRAEPESCHSGAHTSSEAAAER